MPQLNKHLKIKSGYKNYQLSKIRESGKQNVDNGDKFSQN